MKMGMQSCFREGMSEICSRMQSNFVSQLTGLREENKKRFKNVLAEYRTSTERMTAILERFETRTQDIHSNRVATADLDVVLKVRCTTNIASLLPCLRLTYTMVPITNLMTNAFFSFSLFIEANRFNDC